VEGPLTLLAAVAIITQVGILVGIYVMWKLLWEQVERFL
jgi:hypothetical protein